jgi:hypothetical protein
VALKELGMRMGEALLARMPDFASHFAEPLVQQLWPLELQARSSDTLVLDGTKTAA